jgi:hypothetical protein
MRIEGDGCVGEEEVRIAGKNLVTVIMEKTNFQTEFPFARELLASGVMAVNGLVPCFP